MRLVEHEKRTSMCIQGPRWHPSAHGTGAGHLWGRHGRTPAAVSLGARPCAETHECGLNGLPWGQDEAGEAAPKLTTAATVSWPRGPHQRTWRCLPITMATGRPDHTSKGEIQVRSGNVKGTRLDFSR